MPLQAKFSDVDSLGEGMWVTELTESDIRLWSAGKNVKKPIICSIIIVDGANYDSENASLSVDFAGTEALCIGLSNRVLLIQKHASSESFLNSIENVKLDEPSRLSGIEDFLKECRSHGLPEPLVSASGKLLRELHAELPYKLKEGEQRKWTADPNFVALTIQNRNKKVLVSVKGNPSSMNYVSIKPKVSRPPYCEFHFQSGDQLAEVLDVARKSRAY